jgi:predicted nucleic acid-binding protein
VHRRVRQLIESEERLAVTEVVVMEVLAGARDDDYEDTAALYRQCRRAGKTLRSLTDCLIAVVAIRAAAELIHANRDFDTIARHAPLRLVPALRSR